MAGKWLAGGTLASVLAVAALLGASSSAVAAGSTVCNSAGLPSATRTVGVPGVFHVTVMTCGDAKTPTPPACSVTVEQPHLFHVTVFACTPVTQAQNAANTLANGGSLSIPASSAPVISGPTQPAPSDCNPALTVNQAVAGVGVLACAATG